HASIHQTRVVKTIPIANQDMFVHKVPAHPNLQPAVPTTMNANQDTSACKALAHPNPQQQDAQVTMTAKRDMSARKAPVHPSPQQQDAPAMLTAKRDTFARKVPVQPSPQQAAQATMTARRINNVFRTLAKSSVAKAPTVPQAACVSKVDAFPLQKSLVQRHRIAPKILCVPKIDVNPPSVRKEEPSAPTPVSIFSPTRCIVVHATDVAQTNSVVKTVCVPRQETPVVPIAAAIRDTDAERNVANAHNSVAIRPQNAALVSNV
ncbi:MAG: hypothetical protein AAGJ35_06045, partial [Myxococcota bacterium]